MGLDSHIVGHHLWVAVPGPRTQLQGDQSMGLRVSGKNMDGDALRTKSIDDEFAPAVVAEKRRAA
jgi:hypothetical protein